MVCSAADPNENTRTRDPASDGKKWGQMIAPVGPPGDPSDSSAEISRVGSPPAAGDFVEHVWGAGEDDYLTVRQLANPDGQAALNRDLLEFPVRCKPDEITVGRPERVVSSFGTVDRPRLPLIEILDPQRSLRSRGDEGDMFAVG